jgi:subtilisin-like proprotein convertase family protein
MTDRAMAVAPPAVPVCAAPTLQNFANNTDVAISGDAGSTITSTINVSGAPSTIRDVDLFTNIEHQHTGDLRVSLSHLGRTVLIKGSSSADSTGPGGVGAWNDVFAGTLWDDNASAVATDRLYTGDGVVSPLIPEGALAAFNGMNPNGAWTLTIQDTEEGDGGTLRDWSLGITGANETAPTTDTSATNNTPLAIPDGGATVSRSITITGAKTYLTDVNLQTLLNHAEAEDIDMRLSHAGKTVVISTDNHGMPTNATWDDSATNPVTTLLDPTGSGSVTPEGAMAAFIGTNPNGVWTLEVSDDFDDTPDSGGVLQSFGLAIQSTDGCVTGPGPGPDPNPNPAPGGGTTTTPTVPTLPPGPVAKLKPRSVGLKVSGRDRKAPYVINASGKVTAPAASISCTGRVRVLVKAGKKTVTTKTVKLTKACTYTARFTLKKLPKSLPKSGKVTVSARFLGNTALVARTSKAGSVRLG